MRLVEAHLDGPVLRYSNRLRLLGLAGGLGIAPFRGRLLIALVQQARRRAVSGPARRRRWPAATALFLAIQAAILVLAWIVLG